MRRIGWVQLTAALLLSAASISAESSGELLARLKAVGKEGEHNESAAQCLERISSSGTVGTAGDPASDGRRQRGLR